MIHGGAGGQHQVGGFAAQGVVAVHVVVGAVAAAAVGDAGAGKAELVLYDIPHGDGVVAAVHRADAVVAGHDTSGGTHGARGEGELVVLIHLVVLYLHGSGLHVLFKAVDVHLADGLLVGPGAHALTVGFLVVQGKVLGEADQALLGCAAGLGSADDACQHGVLAVILVVAAAKGVAVDVAAGAVPAGQQSGLGMCLLAEGIAHFAGQRGVEGCGKHRLRAVPHVDIQGEGVAKEAVGAVHINGFRHAVCLVGVLDPCTVTEHIVHGIHGELLHILIPQLIVKVLATQVDELELGSGGGGHGHDSLGQVLGTGTGIVLCKVCQRLVVGDALGCGGLCGEGACKVLTAEVQALALLGGIGELIIGAVIVTGNRSHLIRGTRVILAVGDLAVQRVGPAQVGVGGVDGCPAVGILGQVEVVIACVQNVAAVGLVVKAAQVVPVDGDLHRLASTGGQFFGLGKAAQNHMGLFHTAAADVGQADVDLCQPLAGHSTGVGHLHLAGEGVALLIKGGGLGIFQVKGGVAQTVAQRVDDLAVIVKTGVVAVLRLIMGRLIVAVTDVDTLFINNKVVYAVVAALPVAGAGVCIIIVAGIDGRRGGQHIPNVSIRQMTGGAHIAAEDIVDCEAAGGAYAADPQRAFDVAEIVGLAGVLVGVAAAILDEAQLHGVAGIDDHNDCAEVGADIFQHLQLIRVDGQLVAVGVGCTHILAEVAALALVALQRDQSHAVAAAVGGQAGAIDVLVFLYGQLQLAALGGQLLIAGVHIKGAALHQCHIQRGSALGGGRVLAACHVHAAGTGAEQGHLGALGQRQKVALVLQQGGALLHDLLGHLLCVSDGLIRGGGEVVIIVAVCGRCVHTGSGGKGCGGNVSSCTGPCHRGCRKL